MSELDAIHKALSAHAEAVNSRNIKANLDGFTDDQIYLPPGSMPIRGKSVLASLIQDFNKEFAVHIAMEPEETVVAGSWAYQWGFLKGEMRSLKNGETVSMDWKFVYIYQQQSDGSWKIHRDIYNDNGVNEA